MDSTIIGIFDKNMGMGFIWSQYKQCMCQSQTQMFMDITGIDLFDQNVRMACAKVRIRCSWILLVLIFFLSECVYGMCLS